MQSNAHTSSKFLQEAGYIKNLWHLDPKLRGRIIEQMLGHNLHPTNFPVIDKFKDGVATSIKSLDLSAATYQKSSNLRTTLKGYMDKVANFTQQRWGTKEILPHQILGRELELALPHAGNAMQKSIVQKIVQYGKSKGVKVVTKIIKQ